MGVKNLWDILESCKQTLPLHHLQWVWNKRVCVDLSCWVVQLQTACKAPSCAREKVYLRSLFHRLRALIALNCSLIFVTDGSIPAIKLSAYRRRLGPTNEIIPDEANLRQVSSLPRNLGSEFSCMIKEAKMLGSALGIPCLNALEEAEAQCALLNSELLCDGCFSSDSDAFLFGARTVYRDIYLGEGGYVVCYEMADIERYLGFGRNSLIALALLLGSDYSQGVHGLGRETACSIVKSVGDDTVLHQIASEGISSLRKAKSSKNKGQNMNFNGCKEEGFEVKQAANQGSLNNQFLQVIDAYKKPKCHSPDSIHVERVFIPHALQLSQLHQLCEKYFNWTPDRTDEYILPKIAERDLRRFANLRNSSAVLGPEIPLSQMPVTCPVSTIVKQRMQHGKECFEVSWEGVNVLRTSIVAADLVESACPEKIVEYFNEKLVGKKKDKKKTKPKASANKSPIEEINTQLKGLLLDGELQTKELVCQVTSDPQVSPRNADREIIDLSTPLPVSNARRLDKRLEPIIPKNDVIDIYDSDNDVSPEHARKAVELRSFLASIKDDKF